MVSNQAPFITDIEVKGHLEGELNNPILRGRTRSPWLLTMYSNWEDPPSGICKKVEEVKVTLYGH